MRAEDIFLILEVDATDHCISKYRRVVPESAFDVRLEVSFPTRTRRLTVRATSAPISSKVLQTHGFAATYIADIQHFQVELQDKRLSSLFSALVDNFLSALLDANETADPVEVLLVRLGLWKRLFEEYAFDGLSTQAQRGLYSELKFLSNTLLTTLTTMEAVLAWKAPDRTSKDFVHQSVAIEVKSRVAKSALKVRISSENQLDMAGYNLFLVVTELDIESNGGETLPELIEQVRHQLRTCAGALTTFDDQMIRMGYIDLHHAHYEGTRYLPSTTLYKVTVGFPSVRPTDLPPGISHFTYDLDLVSAKAFITSSNVLVDALQEKYV
jgi:hypothetical protein